MMYSWNFDKLRILGAANDWKTALDRDQDFTAVMIDLSKVFNTVYHKLLIDNLAAYGKSYYGSKIIWEIRKRVIVNGAESEWY